MSSKPTATSRDDVFLFMQQGEEFQLDHSIKRIDLGKIFSTGKTLK